MGRSCFICSSMHRAEYDRLRIEGMSIKEICENIAHRQYGENHLKYNHFQTHFANHVEVLINESRKADKLREQTIKEVIKKDIEIVKTFSHNLELVVNNIDKVSKEMNNLEGIMKYGDMFVKLTTECRMIIEQFLKWSNKLDIQDTSEDLFNTIITCMADFPSEYLEKFAKRWKDRNRID